MFKLTSTPTAMSTLTLIQSQVHTDISIHNLALTALLKSKPTNTQSNPNPNPHPHRHRYSHPHPHSHQYPQRQVIQPISIQQLSVSRKTPLNRLTIPALIMDTYTSDTARELPRSILFGVVGR